MCVQLRRTLIHPSFLRVAHQVLLNSHNTESRRTSRNTSSRKFVTSVEELMSAEPRLRNTVIFLKILRVVAPSQSDAGMYTLKNFKKKNYGESRCAYTRLFLCLDLNSDNCLYRRGKRNRSKLMVKCSQCERQWFY